MKTFEGGTPKKRSLGLCAGGAEKNVADVTGSEADPSRYLLKEEKEGGGVGEETECGWEWMGKVGGGTLPCG